MGDKQEISIRDQENCYKAILALVLGFSGFPTWFTPNNLTVRWGAMSEGTAIGLYPLQGSYYISRFVNGSYKALFPFSIYFRCNYNQTNKEIIEAQTVLENLSRSLEESEITFADEHLTIQSITRQSPVFIAEQDEKYTIFGVNVNLRFNYTK